MRIVAAVVVLTLLSASTRAQQPSTSAIFLVVVDDLHLDFRSTPRTRDLLKRLLAAVVREGDQVAIVSTGHSSISERPTADFTTIRAAIDRVTGGGLRPEEILAGPKSTWPVEVPHRASVSLSTNYEAIERLARARPAHLTVIYVSDGFPLTADSEPIGFPEKLTSGDLRRAFGEMIRAANSVNARVYIFWPPGLIGLPFSTPPPDSDEWRRYVSDSTAMLAELAKRTGGMTVMSAGSLVDATKALLAR